MLGIEATAEALMLDESDGRDGKISASVWNNYVKELYTDPEEAKKHEIQNEIGIFDAMKYIKTCKEELQAKKEKPTMGLEAEPKEEKHQIAEKIQQGEPPKTPYVKPDMQILDMQPKVDE